MAKFIGEASGIFVDVNVQKYKKDIFKRMFVNTTFVPDKVIFNGPATIIMNDGKKTVVKRMENDKPNKYKGFVMCLCKSLISSTEWNHLVRTKSKHPNIELAVAESLCEYILGREEFRKLVKQYVDAK